MPDHTMRDGEVVGKPGDFGILVEDCPVKGIIESMGRPLMFCVSGAGPTPETSPAMLHCRYLVVDKMVPAKKDRTVQVACSYKTTEGE